MLPTSSLLRILPLAGALPFVGGAVLLLMGVSRVPYLGETEAIVLSYGLLIVSFMAGVHWGQYLAGVRTRLNLLVSSNVVALGAWFGFLLLPKVYFCLLLIVLFVSLLSIDGHLRVEDRIDAAYTVTRRVVTAVVCLCLLVVAFA